ncbi:MAG: hypothetical protein JFR38_08585 [Muribaculaceae bacterium]|nr:hypothetical protein [Muribaculaceae bacterium]
MSKPSTNTAAREAVRAMLDARAASDAQFAGAYAAPGKSIDGCFDYILKIARKRGNAVCMTDAEVLGLAVHYYDETDTTLAAEAPGAVPAAEVAVAAPQPAPASEPRRSRSRKKKEKDQPAGVSDPLSPMLFDPDER